MAENVIPFPTRLRVVAPEPAAEMTIELIEHDGRLYRAPHLLGRLTLAERERVQATAPRTMQQAWDEAVRRWPALAAEIAAGAQAVR